MRWITVTRTGLTMLLFMSLLLLMAKSKQGETAGPPAQAGNLLQNPGFEGRFRAWSGIPEIQVAAKWTPWWWEDPNHNPAYFRPEYKRALASVFPKRVLSGESAQQWFTFHASHIAGMYQQVFGVVPGQRYRFSIWAQVWSSTEDNPNQSVLPANPHLQIGIDPTGNWNAGSPSVIWSGEASMAGVVDQWGLMVVEATAENDIITVFMRTNPEFANKHNDMYWDNAGLEAVAPPQPTTPPSPTPGPATNTPIAVAVPSETGTPAMTATPQPAATETDLPPATPTVAAPTDTPTATPTETATVTATPTPTDTPTPTETAAPTKTLVASPTKTLVASPTFSTDERDSEPEMIAEDQESSISQQPAEDVVEPDNLGALTLGAIGGGLLLLILLVLVLVKRLRGRQP